MHVGDEMAVKGEAEDRTSEMDGDGERGHASRD